MQRGADHAPHRRDSILRGAGNPGEGRFSFLCHNRRLGVLPRPPDDLCGLSVVQAIPEDRAAGGSSSG